ncbi:MAG: ABC transporter permease, partial [Solirubrobacteraceae bacterium]
DGAARPGPRGAGDGGVSAPGTLRPTPEQPAGEAERIERGGEGGVSAKAGSGLPGRRPRAELERRLRWLAPLVVVAALLAVWQLYVQVSGVSALVLPSPHAVARSLVDDRGVLARNLGRTALEIVLGIVVAVVSGSLAAVAIHLSDLLRRALYPLLVASQAIPVVILFPVLVLWLGFGLGPKLVVIGLVCFFPVVVTTLAGLQAVDPDLVKLMRTFDASRWQIFRRLELPSALPGLFTGTKLAAVFSVIGAVFAEWLGSSSGLGYLLNVTVANLEPAEAFATVFVLSAFAMLLFALLSIAERRMLPWAYRSKDTVSR